MLQHNNEGARFVFNIMGNYSDELKSPLWQRKKTEIQIRDNFKCCLCGRDDIQIHVHHLAYLKGLKAWEYDNEMLVCLCELCHELAHIEMPKIIAIISFYAFKNRLSLIEIDLKLRKNE